MDIWNFIIKHSVTARQIRIDIHQDKNMKYGCLQHIVDFVVLFFVVLVFLLGGSGS